MDKDRYQSIPYWAGDLHRLAQNLEKELVSWLPVSSEETESTELRRRSNVLWMNAVEAGVVIFELCGLGAFDQQPRIKNVVYQVRSEIRRNLQEFKVPCDHVVLNIPYGCQNLGRSFDVYFVKIFEGFCKVWATSYEDQSVFNSYYIDSKEKAKLHSKLLHELGDFLKSHLQNSEPSAC